MTERDMERRLRDALDHAAPDDIEGILSRCEMRKGKVIQMNEMNNTHNTNHTNGKKRPLWRSPWLAAACVALVLAAGGGWTWRMENVAVTSMVSLDVNPSIRLDVNQRERVVAAIPLNDDAVAILDGMDLAGADLNVAVNAVVGSLLQHGYLDKLSSAILISVEDDDGTRAQRIQSQLTDQVDAALKTAAAQASILSQTLTRDTQLEQQAQQSQISTGKAALVRAVQAAGGAALSFDALAALSVEELQQMERTSATALPIGQAKALAIALQTAGLQQSDLRDYDVDPELDEVTAYYEVDLKTAKGETEYRIHGYTGAVLSTHTEGGVGASGTTGSTTGSTTGTTAGTLITEAKAKTIAYETAGISASKAEGTVVKLEWDDGRQEYDVKFWVGTTKYDYDIDAQTGKVVSTDVKRSDSSAPSAGGGTTTGNTATVSITEAKAKTIAYEAAGISASKAEGTVVKLEWDDGRQEYDVKFWVGTTKYDYDIDAQTGKVVSSDVERNDDDAPSAGVGTTTPAATTPITEAKAKSIAYETAGISASKAEGTVVNLDRDDGRQEYDVKFWVGTTKYEYDIDVQTGKVVSADVERNDDDAPAAHANAATGSELGLEEAKSIAAKHAGISTADMTRLETETDWEDGRKVFKLEFRVGGMEYEYEIAAVGGAILDFEQGD